MLLDCRDVKWHQQRQQWWDAQRKRYRPQVWALIDQISEYGIYTTLDFRPEMDKYADSPSALHIEQHARLLVIRSNGGHRKTGCKLCRDFVFSDNHRQLAIDTQTSALICVHRWGRFLQVLTVRSGFA